VGQIYYLWFIFSYLPATAPCQAESWPLNHRRTQRLPWASRSNRTNKYKMMLISRGVLTLRFKWQLRVNKKSRIFPRIRSQIPKAFRYRVKGLGGVHSWKIRSKKFCWTVPLKGQKREIFWSRFFSWIYSIWAPDFEANRIFFSVSFSRSYSNISMNPRCRLLRRFKICAVGYCGDSKLEL
jgi:hypothetical protein